MEMKESARQELLRAIAEKSTDLDGLELLLWLAVLAYQNDLFYTLSGLAFSYTVKRRRDGTYSGELLISRKEGSKTLTRSSVRLAFEKVLCAMRVMEDDNSAPALILPEYKGPKAIGQIFGISYIYSLFWKLGLIRVPESVEDKLKGRQWMQSEWNL